MKNKNGLFIGDEEVIIRGTVVYLNLEPLNHCGIGNLTILTTNSSEIILHLVGGRRSQPYFADVRLGDFIEACGIVTEENTISVTCPKKHYLRLASV